MNVNLRSQSPVQARKQADKTNNMSFKGVFAFLDKKDTTSFSVEDFKKLTPEGTKIAHGSLSNTDIYFARFPETIEENEREQKEREMVKQLWEIPGCTANRYADYRFESAKNSLESQNPAEQETFYEKLFML